MSLEALYFISQIAAAVGLIISLILVAQQLRQTDRTQRAMMQQLRAQRGMDLAISTSGPEMSHAMSMLFAAHEATSESDIRQMMAVMRAMIQNLVDTVWQYKAGFLDRSAYDYTIIPMRRMFATPGTRALWLIQSRGYSAEHVKLVNDLVIEGQPLESLPDLLVTWRAITTQLSAQAQEAPVVAASN